MKQLLALPLCILLFSACSVSSVAVLDKKEPNRPYTKILAIYLDEACDFTFFDSTTYNICIRSCFAKEGNLELRSRVETAIADNLATSGTAVLKSSDLPEEYTNSYDNFQKGIDSLGIDAVLMIDFRNYTHNIQYAKYRPNVPYERFTAGFECYLMNSKSTNIPVWIAQLNRKGKTYSGKKGLNHSMAHKVSKSLKAAGYIAH